MSPTFGTTTHALPFLTVSGEPQLLPQGTTVLVLEAYDDCYAVVPVSVRGTPLVPERYQELRAAHRMVDVHPAVAGLGEGP